jgi:hypothetical protein
MDGFCWTLGVESWALESGLGFRDGISFVGVRSSGNGVHFNV